MTQMIFVNLPVRDLDRSVTFFTSLGYSFNPQFTDETATCMVISDTIFAMLLTHPKYREFTRKEIADSTTVSEVMIALSAESRAAVDATLAAALKGGATEPRDRIDMGFMYNRAFDDLDGHTWEVLWMDPAAVQPA